MNSYEARRLENIAHNKALIKDLGLPEHQQPSHPTPSTAPPAPKRRKLASDPRPSRASARIASTETRPSYNEDKPTASPRLESVKPASGKRTALPNSSRTAAGTKGQSPAEASPRIDVATLRAGWTAWTPSAAPPTRDAETGTFHFASHPSFTPNKSPEEVLREGCFGGAYFRPLYSRQLGTTVADDWKELPGEWTRDPPLDVERYLVSPRYDAEINKYKVACGQSIEEWEAAGWINHAYDVRGWFQWYCRFFMGRRCEDDERQVGRWRKCVGERGRWRRMLLKRYVALGVREVFDDGEDGGGEGKEVSPVVHQTCHHWAFEVRQDVLDEFWRESR
ncbi:hypothetical protein MMC13_005598 [Lambiella insularis]|nr:hypothetical protein [Lambiella insularis]